MVNNYILGLTLSVKTKQGDQFTGELFFYNADARIVILSNFARSFLGTKIK